MADDEDDRPTEPGKLLLEQAQDEDEKEEILALGRISNAFSGYDIAAGVEIERWERNYARLSELHQQLLIDTLPCKIENAWNAVHQNQLYLKSMLGWLSPDNVPPPLCYASVSAEAWREIHGDTVSGGDFEKVLYVLKILARDWSKEYEAEREESYGFICDRLSLMFEDELSMPKSSKMRPRVLVPGCGLARLCADLVQRGFDAIGNEHSYFMLLSSAFVLNGSDREDQWTLFPWVLQQSNNWSDADQMKAIKIPDVLPASLANEKAGSLGMVAGDFVDVFQSPDYACEFDAVATCFFIDTSHNVISYMEIIWDILKPGGIWINLGPLQWHWADSHAYLENEEMSLEVSLDTVVDVAKHIGFHFVHGERGEEVGRKFCHYLSSPNSMRPQGYECALWVIKKPE